MSNQDGVKVEAAGNVQISNSEMKQAGQQNSRILNPKKYPLASNAVQLSSFSQNANGIALWSCLNGPVVFAIGPFVIQEANQPFAQMLH